MPRRDKRRPVDALYDSARWQKRRAFQFSLHPLCQRCEAEGKTTIATVAHHVVPVDPMKPSEFLFFCGELESLCRDCHEAHHDRNPSKGYDTEIGIDGWPVSPAHPANKAGGRP